MISVAFSLCKNNQVVAVSISIKCTSPNPINNNLFKCLGVLAPYGTNWAGICNKYINFTLSSDCNTISTKK